MELSSDFEDSLRGSILDDAEQKAREEIGPRLEEIARENWQEYAKRNDYDLDHIWTDAAGPFVDRDSDSISIRIEWPGLTALFEFGIDPGYTISGNPNLHFYWEAKDAWIMTDEVTWGSVTGGIDESRAIRDAMNEIRRELD